MRGSLRRLLLWSIGGLMITGATLTCCVLPTLLVLVGAGSVLAAMIQTMPGLVSLSEHSTWTFALAGTVLAFNTLQVRRSRTSPCPADPVLAERCSRARRLSRQLHRFSVVLYGASLLVTFVLPRLLFR
mgnify:CR=1 FL=1